MFKGTFMCVIEGMSPSTTIMMNEPRPLLFREYIRKKHPRLKCFQGTSEGTFEGNTLVENVSRVLARVVTLEAKDFKGTFKADFQGISQKQNLR